MFKLRYETMSSEVMNMIHSRMRTMMSSLQNYLRRPWGKQLKQWAQSVFVPLLAVAVFMIMWDVSASQIQTSLGQVPGPAQVWQQSVTLYDEYQQERSKEAAFYQRQDDSNAKKLAENPDAEIRLRSYTGKPTFFDQIITSIVTVTTGFIIASLIAIPIGILCGLNATIYSALNPLIQTFKPISPLAWLPIVTIIVSAVYVTDDPAFSKSFLTSAITVTLCCMWPTIINTTVGVSAVDKDLLNVSRVLRLSWLTHVFKIVLPAAVPMMFAGLRVSFGIGWMVLIAAEMLAQNPGLGKFVWDEFQNGSSDSLARIMVAVLAIGLIGFMLDRVMLLLQRRVSWDKTALLR